MIPATIRIGAIAVACAAAMAFPAAVQASSDLAISQTASGNVVKPGELVTYTVTITNQGTANFADGDFYVNVFSLSGHGQGANNPYQSFSTSQGTCADMSEGAYHQLVCSPGALASGASMQIVAVVTVNQSMNHIAALIPTPYQGGYSDDNNSNNEASVRTTASIPPTVSGSKKIKLKGLPAGCAPGDFTLKAVANVTGVKKMVASLFLGFDNQGVGQTFVKAAKGKHLKAKVPASRLADDLGVFYKLQVTAKRKGAGPLKDTITFQPC